MGGGAPSVQAPKPPDPGQEYASALNAYVQNAPQLYSEEAQYQPLYNQLQQQIQGSNIPFYSQAYSQAYGNAVTSQMPSMELAQESAQRSQALNTAWNYQELAPNIAQEAVGASPQLSALSQFGQTALGATADPTLQGLLQQVQQQTPGQVTQLGNLAAQAGSMFDPTNQQLQNLYGQVGGVTGQGVSQLQGLAGQAAADTRSPIFQQTAQNVMGNLGNLDPLTQQLSDTAQQQLALGGNVSPQQMQDAVQAARASYAARGMLGSTGSIAAEVLGRQQVQQQLLGQREQFASGVSQLVQGEQAQRTGAAQSLTATDIAATQQNQALAGQLYQGAAGLGQAGTQIQAGLQGQIAANLSTAQQAQAGLSQAAINQQTAGTQLASGLQGSILDQIYRQQSLGAQTLQGVYGAQQAAIGQILGSPTQAYQMAAPGAGVNSTAYGTGSPNLFAGSGVLQMVNQNTIAAMNAQGSANMANAASAGSSRGAMIGAGATIGAAAIGAGAMLL